MKKIVAALSLLALAACATTQEMEGPATAFRLTSPGMADNARLPPKAAGNFAKNPNCTGQNVSPALAWSNPPDKTRSYAIIWDDQAGRAGLGVSHGVIYGIPVSTSGFAEGALGGAPTTGAFVPGKSTIGMHWFGPCAPKGNAPQHYVMTLIATELEPNALPAGLTKAELLKALEGKALRGASLVFRFWQ